MTADAKRSTLFARDLVGKVYAQRCAVLTVRTDDGAEVRVAICAGDTMTTIGEVVATALAGMVTP